MTILNLASLLSLIRGEFKAQK